LGVEYFAPLPARSRVLGLGFRVMPDPESMTSSRVPSLIPYFSLSLIGMVVWPFLVTTTSSVMLKISSTDVEVLLNLVPTLAPTISTILVLVVDGAKQGQLGISFELENAWFEPPEPAR
jgi:hypothetical protein